MNKKESTAKVTLTEVQNLYDKKGYTDLYVPDFGMGTHRAPASFSDISAAAKLKCKDSGKEEIWLLCRHSIPNRHSAINENVEFVSYPSSSGSIFSQDCGFQNQSYELVAKNSFEVCLKETDNHYDPDFWDCINNEMKAFEEDDQYCPSLIDFFSFNKVERIQLRSLKPRRHVPVITQLPDKPFLDALQDEVCRRPIYTCLLLDGSPGTGKTTAQVKRLSMKTKWEFLTDEERLYFENEFEDNSDWVFFTPNSLLKSYLKEALARECLVASDSTVWVWGDLRMKILNELKLLGSEKNKASLTRDKLLKSGDGALLIEYAKAFEKFFVSDIVKYLQLKIDASQHIKTIDQGLKELANHSKRHLIFNSLISNQILESYHSFRKTKNIINKFFADSKNVQEVLDDQRLTVSEQELDVFVYVIFSWVFKNSKKVFNERNPNGITDYLLSLRKACVSIDEVTDFSSLQLSCISWICKLGYSRGLCMSGDLMQKLSINGIAKWDDLNSADLVFERFVLDTAYRQTDRLNRFSMILNKHLFGTENLLIPDASSSDPRILSHISNEGSSNQISWIVERIKEIRLSSYRALPSLGIIVPTEDEISDLVDLLKEPLFKEGIDVEGSRQSIGTDSKVRVFAVEHVKGIEFEAVFFLNLDRIIKLYPDLYKQFLYVGCSRCRAYLGICTNSWPKELSFLNDEICEVNDKDGKFHPLDSALSWRSYLNEEEIEEFSLIEQSKLDNACTNNDFVNFLIKNDEGIFNLTKNDELLETSVKKFLDLR